MLFVILLFSACSKNNNVSPSGSKISPPEWLIGEWRHSWSNDPDFRIKKDDFCIGTVADAICYKAAIAATNNKIEQTSSATEYKLTYKWKTTVGEEAILNYRFRLKSKDQVVFIFDSGQEAELYKM